MKKYELWLDESGDFQEEALKKQEHLHPSLVGGILIESSRVEAALSEDLIGDFGGHACRMTEIMKKNHVLPVLEKLKQTYHAQEVFFENTKYEDDTTNRQLYLRMIAEGILQLLITLNAVNESVALEVLIAQRQDVTAPLEQRRIDELEYVVALKKCIQKKKIERKIILGTDTTLEFDLAPAHKETKLQFADYACNIRLTRGSKAFRSEDMQQRIKVLHNTPYKFTMEELGTENYIKQALIQENVSDAMLELYTTKDATSSEEKDKFLNLIIEKMHTMGYRLVKSQLRHCTSEIIAYANHVEDFELGESFLMMIEEHMIPRMQKVGIPIEKLHFTMLLQLADMYLREGDIIGARRTLLRARIVHQSLDSSLEEVFSYYQLLEKEAILYINEFDYRKACEVMRDAVSSYDAIISTMQSDPNLMYRFSKLKSEYLGDALCMQIYAMMFLQRGQPDSYTQLCRLSDRGLKQYSGYEGELERHRQYRAHIECEAHHFSEALTWLILSKGIHVQDVKEEIIVQFLNEVCNTELEMSCCYYLMYYLHIMSEAKLAGDNLSDVMLRALKCQGRLLEMVGLHSSSKQYNGMDEIDMSEIKEESSGILYHPREILWWKYASYLYINEEYNLAQTFYEQATSLCFLYKNYHTMRITGLGIFAEYICCLVRKGETGIARKRYQGLKDRMVALLQEPISDLTKIFIEKMMCQLEQSVDKNGKIIIEELWKVARMITY